MQKIEKIGEICNIKNPTLSKIIAIIEYNIDLCDNLVVTAAKEGFKYGL